jgi:nucleoid-associated protein YgaU
LPVPPRLWIAIALTNGTTYRIGLSHDGGLLYLPEGLYEVSEATSDQVFKWMAEIEADLRKEVISAPKPCAYKVGTVDDGGTLSGIARIFYGDTSKWKKIYEANRSVLKNPDIITGTETLTIPKL